MPNAIRSAFYVTSVAASLLAAQFVEAGEGKSAPVVYKCPDGSQLVVIFSPGKASISLSSGEVLSMTAAASGSGARYLAANGDEFWEHHGEGGLTHGGRRMECKAK